MCVISVIICTHNPRPEYFRRTLEALRAQTLPKENWELLIVDNASKEQVEDTWDISWHPRGRHLRENELGLTPVRLRAIKEASGDLLVFLDDDNVVDSDYLERSVAISVQYPYLGVFGSGKLEPEFEIPPPSELVPLLPMLALRSVPSAIWSNNPKDHESIPWGAGLAVTRGVADHYLEIVKAMNVNSFLDRRGQQLFSGGDDLFSWASVGLKRGFGIFPELRVRHLISAGRLSRSYFLRLLHDHSFSHGVLRYLLSGARPRPPDLFRQMRMLLHGLRNGPFSMRCHWASARGEDKAARFVSENELRPVQISLKGRLTGEPDRRMAASLR
jgi:glycosyltransferase involved in cell wall biosynthesis